MRIILLITMLTVASVSTTLAKFKIPYCSACEYVIPVADLPDSSEFYADEYKSFTDVGYLYKQMWALGIPIWNYDGAYVLHVKDQEVYFEVDQAELKKYEEKYQLDLPANPISFWNKLGGKLILLAVAALIIWGAIDKKKPEVSKEEFFNK